MAYHDLKEFLKTSRNHNELMEGDRLVNFNLEVNIALKQANAHDGPAVKQNPTRPIYVQGLAPVHEVVITGVDIDFS